MTTTITEPAVSDKVDAGARLLDGFTPGWENRIDLDQLRLDNACKCILGQLFDWYWDGLKELSTHARDFTVDDAIRHGFTLDEEEQCEPAWSELTEDWHTLIQGRRSEGTGHA